MANALAQLRLPCENCKQELPCNFYAPARDKRLEQMQDSGGKDQWCLDCLAKLVGKLHCAGCTQLYVNEKSFAPEQLALGSLRECRKCLTPGEASEPEEALDPGEGLGYAEQEPSAAPGQRKRNKKKKQRARSRMEKLAARSSDPLAHLADHGGALGLPLAADQHFIVSSCAMCQAVSSSIASKCSRCKMVITLSNTISFQYIQPCNPRAHDFSWPSYYL
jgi:ribosomal protein L40E